MRGRGEAQVEGDANDFDDTLKRLLSKLQLYHKIRRPSEQGVVEVVKKGSVKKVVVGLEDRQGGRKHITRITHVESFAIDPSELGNLLQRKFQTSSSITVRRPPLRVSRGPPAPPLTSAPTSWRWWAGA